MHPLIPMRSLRAFVLPSATRFLLAGCIACAPVSRRSSGPCTLQSSTDRSRNARRSGQRSAQFDRLRPRGFDPSSRVLKLNTRHRIPAAPSNCGSIAEQTAHSISTKTRATATTTKKASTLSSRSAGRSHVDPDNWHVRWQGGARHLPLKLRSKMVRDLQRRYSA